MKDRASVGTVYAMALLLAGCSLIYELLIAHAISQLSANTVVWYSLTIGIYLGAMGLGALWLERRGHERLWQDFGAVELLLTAVGATALLAIHLGHVLHLYLHIREAPMPWELVAFFGPAFTMIFAVGFLTGVELPLLIRLGNRVSETPVTNRVLGADYIGSLFGGLVFPLLLVPRFELFSIGLATAAVNFAVALYVLARFVPREDRTAWQPALAALLGLGLLIGALQLEAVQQYFLKKYYYAYQAAEAESLVAMFAPMPEMPRVERSSSAYQKIDIVFDEVGYPSDAIVDDYSTKFLADPDFPFGWALFLNGDFQVISNYEEIYHENFAHLPILLQQRVPERVLVLGGGDGLLVRELVKYPQVREIVHVDLDPELLRMAREHPVLSAMNQGALEDARVDTRVGDAYQYVRGSDRLFDAIYLDFPIPKDYNVSKLYSREFYHFVRQRLAPGAFVVFDMPRMDTERLEDGGVRPVPDPDWDRYHATLRAAGFRTIRPFVSYLEHDNPRAYARLAAEWEADEGETLAERDEQVRELMMDYALAQQLGFVVMWQEPRRLEPRWWDLGIPLHVLNERRFRGSLGLRLAQPEGFDPEQVNSITRPTLPSLSVWYIRHAW